MPHQEAPTNVCWGDRNRSVLVRVPLGWTAECDMSVLANPLESPSGFDASQKQTIEIRSADGSADIYLLLAALAVAGRRGFENAEADELARATYVDVNIHSDENKSMADRLAHLPANCAESADALDKQKSIYESDGVFPASMLDGIMSRLRGFNDRNLASEARKDHDLMKQLVNRYFHCC